MSILKLLSFHRTSSQILFSSPKKLDFSRAAPQTKSNPYMDAADRIEKNYARKANLKNVFEVHNLTKQIGHKQVLFKNVHTEVFYGAKIGIIGANGSGKSTFLKILAGIDDMYDGDVGKHPSVKVGYLYQEPVLDGQSTVRDTIREGMRDETFIYSGFLDAQKELRTLYDQVINPNNETKNSPSFDLDSESIQQLPDIEKQITDPKLVKKYKILKKKNKVLSKLVDEFYLDQFDRHIDIASVALNLPPADSIISNLSGGEQRRVALCRLLLGQPDVLLLDEPTNHLDAESVSWLEAYLKDFPGTVMVITHDRYFLQNVADYICEMDPLNKTLVPIKGNYSDWLESKAERIEKMTKEADRQAVQLKEEMDFLRGGSKPRDRTKARIRRYKEKQDEYEHSDSGWRRLERNQIIIPPGPRLGDVVLTVSHMGYTLPDTKRTLFDDVSFTLPSGAILGIIGPNGCGKSTLFKCIIGELNPQSGAAEFGQSVKLGLVQQLRTSLNPANTVWEEIAENIDTIKLGNQDLHIRSYVASFNFRGDDQNKLIAQLSGGERNRVHIAKILKEGYNVLMLDEPSNDLDVDTLRSLEDAIQDFPGSAIVISHDRYFLNTICTHILAFEDDRVYFHTGNYHSYIESLERRKGHDVTKFNFIKMKKRQGKTDRKI